jgi:hypothetical protein
MSTGRYFFQPTIDGTYLSTPDLSTRIYAAVDAGIIPASVSQLESNTRLDVIAFEAYGDATLWWIIAAASGIGWSMQLSPGTYIRVPTNIDTIYELMRS